MLIGLTYDLIDDYLALGWSREEAAEFDTLETIDALRGTLEGMGHTVQLIGGVKPLAMRLIRGERWDLVFNIAEGHRGFGREAQVPCLLDAYGVPYTFSDPLTLSLALHKGMAKHVIRGNGIPTPAFSVVHDVEEAGSVAIEPPLFVKPVAEGTGKGISSASVVSTHEELLDVVRDLTARFSQPVLVEQYISGPEYTVGILGTGRDARSLGVMKVTFTPDAEEGGYSFVNKANYERATRYELATGAEMEAATIVAIDSWKALECRDAGRIDLRSDENGQPHFLEANPLAGLNPKHSDLPILCRLGGIPYEELIRMIVEAALARLHTSEVVIHHEMNQVRRDSA